MAGWFHGHVDPIRQLFSRSLDSYLAPTNRELRDDQVASINLTRRQHRCDERRIDIEPLPLWRLFDLYEFHGSNLPRQVSRLLR
jgi:hypothetical protein